MIRVVCVVAGDPTEARAIAAVLEQRVTDGPSAPRILRAPDALLGSAFWRSRWRDARAWWEDTVGADPSEVLLLIDHAPGLANEVRNTAGRWAVWCTTADEAAMYANAKNVLTLVAADAGDFAEALTETIGTTHAEPALFRPAWGPFQRVVSNAVVEGRSEILDERPTIPSPEIPPPTDVQAPLTRLAPNGARPVLLVEPLATEEAATSTASPAWGPSLNGILVDGDDTAAVEPLMPVDVEDAVDPEEKAADVVGVNEELTCDERDADAVSNGADGSTPMLSNGNGVMVAPDVASGELDVAAADSAVSAATVIEPPLARLAAVRPLESEPSEGDGATIEDIGDGHKGRPSGPAALAHLRARVVRRVRPPWPRRARLLPTRTSDEAQAGTIGQRLMRAHSTVLLSCSPKGGVAKTNDVIGASELAAQAVEPFGIDIGLLDMNLVNPDVHEALGLAEGAPTVRDLVRALGAGTEPLPGASPVDSNLRVYVGDRETGGFTRGEIDRLAEYTRTRWALTAVDLANCLPDAAGSEAAATLMWWLRHADVLMVPIDPTPLAFRGAMSLIESVREQVGAGVLDRMPGVVMPMLIRPDGEAARDPQIAALVHEFEVVGARIVIVPASEEVQLASWPWRETSIVTADETVRHAYWEILHAALEVHR